MRALLDYTTVKKVFEMHVKVDWSLTVIIGQKVIDRSHQYLASTILGRRLR
jgi:hypothetical protein